MTKSVITKLERIELKKALDGSTDIDFHFAEGGESVRIRKDANAINIVYELRYLAERIQRRTQKVTL